jgi:hypothetical protein
MTTIPGFDAGNCYSGLLAEAAAVVGGALVIALCESTATADALIVVGFAYPWVTARNQLYSPIALRQRYYLSALGGLDTLAGMHR